MGADNEFGKPKPRKPAQMTVFGATRQPRRPSPTQIKKWEAARLKAKDLEAYYGTPEQRRMLETERRGQLRLDDAPNAPKTPRSNPLTKGNSGNLGAFFLTGVGLPALQSFSGGIDDLWLLGRGEGNGAGGDYKTERKKK